MQREPSTPDPVAVTGLHTRGRGQTQLSDISLQVHHGEAVSLLGGRGAGKSALLAHILGLRESRSRAVAVFGQRPHSNRARKLVGYAPQEPVLPRFLYVHEVLDFVSRHYDDPIPTRDLADHFSLRPLLDRPAAGLSRSEERQITVALAFVGRPRLAVLDEPTADLDRDARVRIRSILKDAHRHGTALLIATSDPDEATALADRVVLMQRGRLRYEGAREQLLRQVGTRQVSFRTDQPARMTELDSVVGTCGRDRDVVSVATDDVDRLLAELAGRRIAVRDVSVRTLSLPEVESLLVGRVRA